MLRSGVAWAVLLTACGGSGMADEEEERVPLLFPDEDGDTIIDLHEDRIDELDSDGDGIADYLDLDSDNDDVQDALEAGDTDPATFPIDTDVDGVPDYLDLDADGNCVPDGDEGGEDLDDDQHPAASDLDDDGDGIDDVYEIGASCEAPDTDGDGTPDFQDLDSDGDGIGDVYEAGNSAFDPDPADTDADGVADYLDLDADGDGLSDADEGHVDTPADEPRDTDDDGVYDFVDTDSDNDGLTDSREIEIGTDPTNYDTDEDGFTDGAEVASGTDPLDPDSEISGIYVEVSERTDVEEVFAFTLGIELGDVAFVLDTTCSMQSTLNAMADEFATMIGDLESSIEDAEYAVCTFDDYNYGDMGAAGDKPFWLQQEVTSDTAHVQTVLNGLYVHNGVDEMESGSEALLQTLTGAGYDQNCNGIYDSNKDVAPYIATAGDPFGGVFGAQKHDHAGGGDIGGVGFRAYALPIVVYATDAPMRNSAADATPGGCPGDASVSQVINAANDIGAKLIGVNVDNGGGNALGVMGVIADGTDSFADLTGDGSADDALVFTWGGSSAQFRNTVVGAIEDLVDSIQFGYVELAIENDPNGFVVDIDPAQIAIDGAFAGDVVEFTLTFRGTVAAGEQDQLYTLTLNVLGDGEVLLDSLDVSVLVPGTEL